MSVELLPNGSSVQRVELPAIEQWRRKHAVTADLHAAIDRTLQRGPLKPLVAQSRATWAARIGAVVFAACLIGIVVKLAGL